MSASDSEVTAVAGEGGLPVLLARAGQHAVRALEADLAPFGVSLSQYLILARLASDGEATAGALARHTVTDSGAMTRLLDRMADACLLERRPDPRDRRQVRLALTEHGRLLLPVLNEAIARVRATLAMGQSSQALDPVIAYLHAVLALSVSPKETV